MCVAEIQIKHTSENKWIDQERSHVNQIFTAKVWHTDRSDQNNQVQFGYEEP